MSDIVRSSLTVQFSRIRMSAIGNICGQWANIEYQVAHIIWLMLDLNVDVGKIVTGGLDMQPRLNVAILLARQLGAPRYVIKGLTDARKAIQDGLDMERNRAVHGISFPSDNLLVEMVEVHRGKGPKTPQEVPISELNRLGDDLSKLGTSLNRLFNQMHDDQRLESRFAMARKMRREASETVSDEGSQSQSA